MKMQPLLLLAGVTVGACAASQSGPPTAASTGGTPASSAPAEPVRTVGGEPELVTLKSPSPLIAVKIMVRAGSVDDPPGKEGLAYLAAYTLIEGAFGDTSKPTTKEALAARVQPWGKGAMPQVEVSGRTTTFSMTIPRDVLETYIAKVLRPMLTQPLFREAEIERLKGEMGSLISNVRHETLEGLGLAAIDQYVNEGTRFEHPPFGTESSLAALTRGDVLRFYAAFYRPSQTIVGVSTSDPAVVTPVLAAVRSLPAATAAAPETKVGKPKPIEGRRAVVVVEPNAPAAGVHLGFPLTINRTHDDYWPLYVAQTWLGVHRDAFGRLYQAIRETRGYNYGNYAYIEHWDGKPSNLFRVFNQPREQQYFSIWLRPVGYDHAYHLCKAATWELDRLIRHGLTSEQVAEAKNKAKVLYLNLGETVDRLLAARMDDAFYGMKTGYLEDYIRRIESVTPAQVNAAIQKHLQVENLKYVIVTDAKHADALVDALRTDRPAYGKSPADYAFRETKANDRTTTWQIPGDKLDVLRLDAVWAHYPLGLDEVRKTEVEALFKTGAFIAESP